MAEVSKTLLTIEERIALKKKVEIYEFEEIVRKVKAIESRLDSVNRLDTIDYYGVNDLRLALEEISKDVVSFQNGIENSMFWQWQRLKQEGGVL